MVLKVSAWIGGRDWKACVPRQRGAPADCPFLLCLLRPEGPDPRRGMALVPSRSLSDRYIATTSFGHFFSATGPLGTRRQSLVRWQIWL